MKDKQLMRDTRKQLRLTQHEMAKKIGYGNQKDISRIETGAANMSRQVRQLLKLIRKYEL